MVGLKKKDDNAQWAGKPSLTVSVTKPRVLYNFLELGFSLKTRFGSILLKYIKIRSG